MNEPGYKNIAILRLSALGDIVHTLRAFTLLRGAYPQAKISWFVEPAGAKLLENFQGIDQIIIIDFKKKGLVNKLKEIKRIRSQYAKTKTFDLVLDFQGLLKSAVLAFLLNGTLSVGFHKKNLREPAARFFYKRTVDFFYENSRDDLADPSGHINHAHHVVLKNIHLANFNGRIAALTPSLPLAPTLTHPNNIKPLDWGGINVKLKDLAPWEKSVQEFLTRHRLEIKNFLTVNIGGGWESKLLFPRQYIEIVNGVREKYGSNIVILWGNQKEQIAAQEISRETGAVMTDFFNFSQLLVFLRYSRLLVSGDSLPLHLADLVKTPSVGIFGPTSPFRNGSLMADSVSIYEKLSCGFCYKKKCGTIDCIKNININKIIQAIGKLYEKFY
ncbi:MAG TPA: glycosyltransferase family 9 protein [Candidatus Deferrimicrobium sp.]|nr:glycosyltransferase family 9 protein [Candidatus Deferrimicrobium sp.]